MKTKFTSINRLIVLFLVLLMLPYGVSPAAVTVVAKKSVLDPAKIYIPESCGKVDKVSPAPGADKTVVLVKDAHCIYEAQENIAGIMELLVKDYGVETICAEGAAGEIDLSLYRDFPDQERRDQVTEEFIRKGYFSAIELFGICKAPGRPFQLLGAEDSRLYLENFIYFRKNFLLEKEVQGTINGWENVLDRLKGKVYSEKLTAFDEMALNYRNLELPLSEWIKYLCQQLPQAKEQPVLSLTLKCLDLEEAIDFQAVEEEREKVLKLLLADLPQEEMMVLVKKGLQLHTGKISPRDYYSYLGDRLTVLAGGRPQLSAENLTNYINLIKLQSGIDEEELFRQLDNTEATIYDRLFENEEQRKLHRLGYRLYVFNKLFQLKVTREELAYFDNEIKNREEEIVTDLRQLANEHKVLISHQLAALPETEVPEGFYQLAVERDRAMAENVIREMGRSGTDAAVLVAGGFHAEGISEILRQRDINCVTVTPVITQAPEHNPYLRVMMDRHIDPERIQSYIAGALSAPRQGCTLAAVVNPQVIVDFCRTLLAGTTWQGLSQRFPDLKQAELQRVFEQAGISTAAAAPARGEDAQIKVSLEDWLRLQELLIKTEYLSIEAQKAIREYLADAPELRAGTPFQLQVDKSKVQKMAGEAFWYSYKPETFARVSPEMFVRIMTRDLVQGLINSGVFTEGERQEMTGYLEHYLGIILAQPGNRQRLIQALAAFAQKGFKMQFNDYYPNIFGDDDADGKVFINAGALMAFRQRPQFIAVLLAVGLFGHEIIGHESGEYTKQAVDKTDLERQLTGIDVLTTLCLLGETPAGYQANLREFFQLLRGITAGGLYPVWLEKAAQNVKDEEDLRILRMLMTETPLQVIRHIGELMTAENYADVRRIASIAAQAPDNFNQVLDALLFYSREQFSTIRQQITGPDDLTNMRSNCEKYMGQLFNLWQITQSLQTAPVRDPAKRAEIKKQLRNINASMTVILREIGVYLLTQLIIGWDNDSSRQMLLDRLQEVFSGLHKYGFPAERNPFFELISTVNAACTQLRKGKYDAAVTNFVYLFSRLISYSQRLPKEQKVVMLNVLQNRFDTFTRLVEQTEQKALRSYAPSPLTPPVTARLAKLKEWFAESAGQTRIIKYQINFEGMEPAAVIPDIHGNVTALRTLIRELKGKGIKKFIFLGDYIDRDPHSLEVLAEIENLRNDQNLEVVCLYGNHEIMFIAGMSGNTNAFFNWFLNAGYVVLEQELGISGSINDFIRYINERDRRQRGIIWGEIVKKYMPLAQANSILVDKFYFMLDNFQMYYADSANILYIHNLFDIDQAGNFISTMTSRDGQRSLQGMEIIKEAQAALAELRAGKGATADWDFLWEMWQPWTAERQWGDVMSTPQGEKAARKMLKDFGGYSATITAHDIEKKPGTNDNIPAGRRELRKYHNLHYRADTGMAEGYGGAGMALTISSGGLHSHKFTVPKQQDALRDAQQEVDPTALSEAMYGKDIARLGTALANLLAQVTAGLAPDLLTGIETDSVDYYGQTLVIPVVPSAAWVRTPVQPTVPAPLARMEWFQVRAGEYRGELTPAAVQEARGRVESDGQSTRITVSTSGGTIVFTIDRELAALGISQELLLRIAARIAGQEGIDLAGKEKNITIAMVEQSETYFVNHTSDGFIGINADFLSLFSADQQAGRQIMLEVGLNHEMRHELTGKSESPAVKTEFRQKDMVLLLELTAGEMTDLLDTLLRLGLLKGDFIKEAIYTNLRQVMAERLPGFQLELSEAELADLFSKIGLNGAELVQEGELIAFVDQIAVQVVQRAGVGEVSQVKELMGNVTDRLRRSIQVYLQARQKAVAASVVTAEAIGVGEGNINEAVAYMLAEGDEDVLKGKVTAGGKNLLSAFRAAAGKPENKGRLLAMLRGVTEAAKTKDSFPVLQPAPMLRQKPGVIVQDVADVFPEVTEAMIEIKDGKMMVSHKLLDSGLREWLEAIRDEDGYDGISFGFVLSNPGGLIEKDGYLTTREELLRQLIMEHTGLRADQFVIAGSVTEVAEKSEEEKKDNIVYLSSSFTDEQRADLARQGIKIIQKGQTGMPVALHWAAVMLDLEIDEVYDAEGRATPFLVMLYANFVDGLFRAGILDGGEKDRIIKEVMEKGYIVLPAVTTVTEFLQNLQRATQLTAVAA